MDKALMHIKDRLHSNEYSEGVKQFIAMVKAHASRRVSSPTQGLVGSFFSYFSILIIVWF